MLFEVEHILRYKYNIQIELADITNILAIFTFGDSKEHVQKLIQAMKSIALKYKKLIINKLMALKICIDTKNSYINY